MSLGWPYLAAVVVMRLALLTRVRKVVLGLALPGSIGGDEAGIVDEGEKVVLGLALPGSIGCDEAGIVDEGEKGCS